MRISPNQTRILLVFVSTLFTIYTLVIELTPGGNPVVGVAIAAPMVLFAVSAIRSKPGPEIAAGDRSESPQA